ncbi:MAG: hypothetical protein WCQ50_06500 [Spirochaetota bacterium]
MVSFYLKKAFFDGWDHLFGLAALNAVFLALAFGGISLAAVLPTAIGMALGIVLWFGLSIVFAATVAATMRWSDYGDFQFGELFGILGKALVPGLQFGLFVGMAVLALAFTVPFYMGKGLLGAGLAGLILWLSIAWIIGLQFYLPLCFRLGGGLRKNLRKSFLLLLDNLGISAFLFVWSLLTLVVSPLLAFLAPGPAGVALAWNDALRLLLLKYDWREAHKGEVSGSKAIPVPWKELFVEEEERVGKRSLKGMFFPWKD